MLNEANATVRLHEIYIFMLCCLSPRRMHWIRSDPSTLRRCNPLPRPKPQPLDAPAPQNKAVSLRSWNIRLQKLGGDVQLRLSNNCLTGFKLLSPAGCSGLLFLSECAVHRLPSPPAIQQLRSCLKRACGVPIYRPGGGDNTGARVCMAVQKRAARMSVYGLLLFASNLFMADMARLHTYIRPLELAYVDAGP